MNRDYEIWVLLHQTRDAVAQAREKELKDIGVNIVQAGLLYIIKNVEPRPTISNIARWMNRKPHTIHSVVGVMEKHGLVKKKKDLERKNLARIAITQKGEKALEQAQERTEAISDIMSCLTDKEVTQLHKSLKKVRDKAYEKLWLAPLDYP